MAVGTHGLSPRSMLGETLRQKSNEDSGARLHFKPWALQVPEAKTGILNFDDWRFQEELYSQECAECQEVVIKKATQIGVSTYLLRWIMYHVDLRGLTGIYFFPTEKLMYDFCLAGDERVLMADGTAKPVVDIREGDQVLSSDGEKVVTDEVTAAWSTGRQRLLRIQLEGGREIRATGAHRVFTQRGWLRARYLTDEDSIQVARTLPETEDSSDLSVDDAFLIALWLAEGSKTRAGFTITCGNEAVRERAREIANRRGWDVYEGGRHNLALTAKWARTEDTPAAFLRRYGLRGMRTDTISIPDEVLRGGRSAREEFWRTYVACDGAVMRREVTVASVSKALIKDMRILAASLGMPGTIRTQLPKYPGAKRCWYLAVAEKAARALSASIGVYGKPDNQQLQVLEKVQGELGWARVKCVEADALEETYDLETATHHAFFVEGGLTHNSDARIKTAIRASQYLSGRISREYVDNKGLKQIGTGMLYCRGSESVAAVQSVDADLLVLDEYSELRRENIPDIERRLGASPFGLIRRVGVPDIPNMGLDKLYQDGDQRQWRVKCERCGKHQDLTYENVDEEKIWVRCRLCLKGPLDVRQGEWVATYPDREVRSYHIPKLAAPLDKRRIKQIIVAHRQTSPSEVKTHFNKDLGLAYAPEEGRLSLEAIQRAQREELPLEGPRDAGLIRTMGVDVASVRDLNVRISAYDNNGTKRSIFLGTVEGFPELVRLFKRYQPHFATIDHEPEGRLSRAFAEKFPGRVWLVAASGTQREVLKPDKAMRFVSVNRTLLYDATFDAIRQQRNLLPGVLPEDYARDMQNLMRRVEVNEEGKAKIYYERIGPEDYAQAEMYDMVAEAVYLWLKEVGKAEKGETFELEDEYDFERSHLNSGSTRYEQGFESEEWTPGFEG